MYGTVSEENSLHDTAMHFRDHPMHKPLCLGVREGFLIILLVEAINPMVWLHVIYTLFRRLASLKNIPLVASGTLSTFFQLILITHWK